jgi:RHS repeat-associated protein
MREGSADWRQQADSDPAKMYHLGHDGADQLTAATLKSTDPTPAILKRYYYAYDPAGNRTAEQIDDATTGATYNNMNQLVAQQAGGALIFKGTVSEPASVSVGGRPATVTADGRFEAQAVVPGGTGQVAVTATDPAGNLRTNTYEVTQGATSASFTYDANGNMTSDGTRTYEWDAENRLVAVKEGATAVASYTYNKDGIRTSKTVAGMTTRYVLDGWGIAEERSNTGEVAKHFQGATIDNVLATQDPTGVVSYLTSDHLRSIREHVTPAGMVTLRRDYDPWGRLLAGASIGGWAFTGRENELETGLHYYRARYYAPSFGIFLSEDWAHPGTFVYASANPVNLTDPTGEDAIVTFWVHDAFEAGHPGIGVNTNDTEGFYSTHKPLCLVWGCSDQGRLLRDWPHHPGQTPLEHRIRATPQQDCAMCEAIRSRRVNPGPYNLYHRNCALFVAGVLNAAGIRVPMTRFPYELWLAVQALP